MLELLEKCSFIFNTLENAGYECYAVGGCVRDILLGVKPHDIDFTTNALPDEILQCFKDCKTFELGKKYGTVSVICNNDVYEITTFRVDGSYTDLRHPEEVRFARTLLDDLSRRDFTVNSMAMDKSGAVVDAFNGKEDLKNGLIRAVGDPEKRFSEDALRIFRAIRFSARLGFSIQSETAAACKKLSPLVGNIHPQRLRAELTEFIVCDTAPELLLEYREVFAAIIPELELTFDFPQVTPHHRYDVFTHTAKAMGFAPKIPEIRLALLFHDIAKPLCFTQDKAGLSHFNGHPEKSAELAEKILKRFGFASDFVNRVKLLVKYHDIRFENPRLHIKGLLQKLSPQEFSMLLTVQRCDTSAQSEYLREQKLEHINRVEEEFKSILKDDPCINLKDLKIDGNDIKELGVTGKCIGEILNLLLKLVLEEKLSNDREVLLAYVADYISRIDN